MTIRLPSIGIHRSLVLIGCVTVVAMSVIIAAGWNSVRVGATAAARADDRQTTIILTKDAELDLANLSTLISRRLNYGVYPAVFRRSSDALLATLSEHLRQLDAATPESGLTKAKAAVGAAVEEVRAVVGKIQQKPTADDEQKSIAAISRVEQQLGAIREALSVDYRDASAAKQQALEAASSLPVIIGLAVAVVVMGLVMLLSRGITDPLARLQEAMERLAQGVLESLFDYEPGLISRL